MYSVKINKKIAPAILLLLAGVPLLTVAPVSAGKPVVTYSCTVSVQVTIGVFYVRTTITATGGTLPSPELDFVSSYKNGVLYNTQSVTNDIPKQSTSFTFIVVVSTNGAGAYSFNSQVGRVNGHGQFTQLAFCYGNYNL